MARRKLTEEEVLLKQKEKEEKQAKAEESLAEFRESLKNAVDGVSTKVLLDFKKTCEEYEMEEAELLELLFKKFANGDFKFKAVVKYE